MYELMNLILRPYTLLLLCLIVWLVWVWRAKAQARRALLPGLVLLALLWLLSTRVAGYLTQGSLEWPFPPTDDAPANGDIVLVLGGNVYIDDDQGTKVRIGPDTFYRCLHAAQLYKRAGRCRMIVSGGRLDRAVPAPPVADTMRDFLVQLDIDPADIVLENQATSTHENALYSAALLQDRGSARVFLVTDATHMRRARRCFLRQGIVTTPAPCNFRARKLVLDLSTALPSVEGITGVQRAFHEWLGLAWYWLRGRI
jgi:uncharacterized SAM-binding protein YcdF (DUF218 family)